MGGEYKHEQQQRLDSNSRGEAEIKSVPNPKCPRCDSINTKFCYFNNYKTSQPRYACKNCKRFWTYGGNVRNISTKGEERKMKCVMDCSPSGGSAKDSASTALSPPITIGSTSGNFIYRVGTLNITRHQPASNQPQLKFVRVDTNNLSLTQGFNRVLNPYMAFPQDQIHLVHSNHQVYQASYGQGFEAQLKPSNHLGISWGDPSCLNTKGANRYMERNNAKIFWDNRNQVDRTHGGLSGSSYRSSY